MSSNIDRDLAKRSDMHLARKVWHVLCGSAALLAYYTSDIDIKTCGYIALVISLCGFGLDFLRLHNKKFNEFALKVMGPLMRKSEMDSFSGLPFYALGIALTILLFQKDIALLSIMFLVFADPMASVVGVLWGKDKILPNKSLQGTLAGFFICYAIVMLYLLDASDPKVNILGFSLAAAVVGAVSELLSAFNIDDNLTIPVISGAGLTILNFLFYIF